MYVVETIKDKDTGDIYYRCLHDINSTQLKEWENKYKDDFTRKFYKITANNAHNWVKNGGLHTTLLFLEGNRIRKAS